MVRNSKNEEIFGMMDKKAKPISYNAISLMTIH